MKKVSAIFVTLVILLGFAPGMAHAQLSIPVRRDTTVSETQLDLKAGLYTTEGELASALDPQQGPLFLPAGLAAEFRLTAVVSGLQRPEEKDGRPRYGVFIRLPGAEPSAGFDARTLARQWGVKEDVLSRLERDRFRLMSYQAQAWRASFPTQGLKATHEAIQIAIVGAPVGREQVSILEIVRLRGRDIRENRGVTPWFPVVGAQGFAADREGLRAFQVAAARQATLDGSIPGIVRAPQPLAPTAAPASAPQPTQGPVIDGNTVAQALNVAATEFLVAVNSKGAGLVVTPEGNLPSDLTLTIRLRSGGERVAKVTGPLSLTNASNVAGMTLRWEQGEKSQDIPVQAGSTWSSLRSDSQGNSLLWREGAPSSVRTPRGGERDGDLVSDSVRKGRALEDRAQSGEFVPGRIDEPVILSMSTTHGGSESGRFVDCSFKVGTAVWRRGQANWTEAWRNKSGSLFLRQGFNALFRDRCGNVLHGEFVEKTTIGLMPLPETASAFKLMVSSSHATQVVREHSAPTLAWQPLVVVGLNWQGSRLAGQTAYISSSSSFSWIVWSGGKWVCQVGDTPICKDGGPPNLIPRVPGVIGTPPNRPDAVRPDMRIPGAGS